jgi:Na+-translocating ferredoxin:NAD+ oxidoreductase RnfC subunit
MVLYLIRVEAAYGADVSLGDQVIEGQRLGIAADRHTPVLSPTRGVVRAVVLDAETHAFVIHVLNKDEDAGFTTGRGNGETFCARVGGFGL